MLQPRGIFKVALEEWRHVPVKDIEGQAKLRRRSNP
jgi:hypothetical protein